MKNLYKLKFSLLIGISIIFSQIKTFAFIPYYFLPDQKFLKKNTDEINKGAISFLERNEIEDAIKRAYLSHSLDKTNYLSSLILSEAFIIKNDLKSAKKFINNAIKYNNKIPDIYLSAAKIYFLERNLKKSKDYVNKCLKLKKDEINCLFLLGNIHLKKKSFVQSIIIFEEILKINNKYWPAHNNIGLANFELGKIELSKNNFISALKYSNNPESILALSMVLFQENSDNNQSFNIAKKAIKMNRKFINSEYRRSELWGDKIQKITSQFFKKYYELNDF